MKPDEIDKILTELADPVLPLGDNCASIGRIERAILDDLRPVHPLAPAWVFTVSLAALFVVMGAGIASVLGMHGIHVLSNGQRASIFSMLVLAAWLAAVACAREMRPAAGPRLGPLALVLSTTASSILFSLVFHVYNTWHFVAEGIPCLVAGMCVSVPTGMAIAFILRRGFVMDWKMAGIAAGTLSGLTGLGMLELHCQNLKAIHVIVWHVAVVVASGMLGFAVGSVADYFRHRRGIGNQLAPFG